MELPIPLLMLSDAPDQRSGLARITRDLCSLLVGQPEWRVASCGWMGRGSVKLPWQQYHCHPSTFGEYDLPAIWDEFSSGQIGVILTIWDLTRVGWLARPDLFDSAAREWCTRVRSRVRLWGYIPVDSTGPGNRLTTMSRETLLGFDRLLAYSPFGEEVIRNTIGAEEAAARDLSWMPHAINMDVFKPMHTLYNDVSVCNTSNVSNSIVGGQVHEQRGSHARIRQHTATHAAHESRGSEASAGIEVRAADEQSEAVHSTKHDEAQGDGAGSHAPVVKIGVVATNQARKDWGLVAAIARRLADVRDDVRWWWHTDQEIREWSLPALIADFNLTNVEVTTEQFTDQQMAALYRTCALTLAPGLGEGYCFPAFESLACGVPVLHGDYAGCASLMRTCGLEHGLIQPDSFRIEGQHNCLRPVHSPEVWVEQIVDVLDQHIGTDVTAERVQHLDWRALGPRWRRWFRDGIGV